ncbi:MAG: hypothetical protein ACRBDL_08165 [Alphaproteobacteria bacterium]
MVRAPNGTPILFPKAADVAFDRIYDGFQSALDEADNIRHDDISLTQAQYKILEKNAGALDATYNAVQASYGRVSMDISAPKTRYNTIQTRWAAHDLLHVKEQEFQDASNVLITLMEQPGINEKLTNPQFIRELDEAEHLMTERYNSLNNTLRDSPFYTMRWRDQYDAVQNQIQPILGRFKVPESKAQPVPEAELETLRDKFGQVNFAIFDFVMDLQKRNIDQPHKDLPDDIPAAIDAFERQLDESMSALQEACDGRTQFLNEDIFTYQRVKDALEQVRESEEKLDL